MNTHQQAPSSIGFGAGLIISWITSVVLLFFVNPFVAILVLVPFIAPLWITPKLALFLAIPAFLSGLVIRKIAQHDKNSGATEWSNHIVKSIIFLTSFFVLAELMSWGVISVAARLNHADCLYRHSFLSSVQNFSANHSEHALYKKDDVLFLWSYRRMEFLQAKYSTSHCLKLKN